MAYEVFCAKAGALARKLGLSVSFSHKNGRYYANVSDGTCIVGNSTSSRVEYNWGSGHKAYGYI